MGEMEYNKGKLIPLDKTFKEIYEEYCGEGAKPPYGTYEEYIRNNADVFGVEVLKSKLYKVVWEIQSGELDQIDNVQKLPDGSIMFETYHYNGGGHWTELVEGKL